MNEHFDDLETREPEAREGALMAALPAHIAHAKANAPGFARILRDVDPNQVKSRKSLARLPVTRKSHLSTLQKESPPLGGLNATPVEKLAKLFISPGPIYDPEGHGKNWWRSARGLFAGGFRAGDLVINTFAYHFTPAGSMLETGALALGCTLVPAGVGQTEMQVAAIRDLSVRGYIGTPSFLKLIVEKADELKADLSSLKKAQVGAEYLPPSLRNMMKDRGILVVPDVICNAGGVTVSYFEWVQDFSSFFWSEDEINVRLDKIMVDALKKIWDTADHHKVTLRTATFAVACERILMAREERGLYP